MNISQFFLLLYCSIAQWFMLFPEKERFSSKTVVIDSQSSIIEILGTTNVNEFSCRYFSTIAADSLKINLVRDEGKMFLSAASIQLPIALFECDNGQMTHDFKALLNREYFPNITIDLLKIYTKGQLKNHVEASISLAGRTKIIVFPIELSQKDEIYYCKGKPQISIIDFGLTAPEKFFGLVKVNEDIFVKFSLVFEVLDT